ncbi:MAG: hypothetical protein ACQSGP_25015 [Frankia sp.]
MLERNSKGPFRSLGGVVEETADVGSRRPHPEHVAGLSVVDGEPPHLAVLPGLPDALRSDVEQWATDRVMRLRSEGPAQDGWGVWILGDGRMAAQLWVRPVRVTTPRAYDPYRTEPRGRAERRHRSRRG